MVQVPPVTIVTVVEATVQTAGVVEAKLTVRAELAVALTPNVPAVKENVVTAGVNVIVWAAGVIVKSTETGVAAAKLALPAWVA